MIQNMEMIQTIKELPRLEDGIFDTSALDGSLYRAADKVYPVYTAYETTENKKEGYPDIMQQMRALEKRVEKEFSRENAVWYLKMLADTIAAISPEIYENYRELIEMFRSKIKAAITEFGLDSEKEYGGLEKANARVLYEALQTAFEEEVLLKEKYESLAEALVK